MGAEATLQFLSHTTLQQLSSDKNWMRNRHFLASKSNMKLLLKRDTFNIDLHIDFICLSFLIQFGLDATSAVNK